MSTNSPLLRISRAVPAYLGSSRSQRLTRALPARLRTSASTPTSRASRHRALRSPASMPPSLASPPRRPCPTLTRSSTWHNPDAAPGQCQHLDHNHARPRGFDELRSRLEDGKALIEDGEEDAMPDGAIAVDHNASVPRPRGFWMSRISRPRLKMETVPVDWETQTAIESVVTVIAAAASWRVPRPW